MTEKDERTDIAPTNEEALTRLLDSLEKASDGIQRDKGTRFETLIRDWLTKEPTYKDLFSSVLTFKAWSKEHPEFVFNGRDIGVDLVGVNAEGNGFTAIQCKFYGKNAKVGKGEVDSFIAASNIPCFTHRMLIATNESWTNNVTKQLQTVTPPITLITRETLAQSTVDWGAYQKGEVKILAKRVPREYQKEAIKDVIEGFKTADRGKLIMACGTGKTFTSMKIAEDAGIAGKGGFVLFLVPSLSLLSQTLSDWKQQCKFPIKAFAVCSDNTTGKADLEDLDSLTVGSELSYPATTNAKQLAVQVNEALKNKDCLTVIFSTYQSLDVIHQAQHLSKQNNRKQLPLVDELKEPRLNSDDTSMKSFDLIVCDEAHRTVGGYYSDEKEAVFTRVHDNDYVKAKKRLYMTATPKIYGAEPKKQQEQGEIVLFSMDDDKIFGKVFHSINFSTAVKLGSLVDYKVIVLTVSESLLDGTDSLTIGAEGGLSVPNSLKVIGCWRALSKRDMQGEVSISDDLKPMKRAVGFAQVIEPTSSYDKVSSKAFTAGFQSVIEDFKERYVKRAIEEGRSVEDAEIETKNALVCDTRHIDGSMNATEKAERLEWLRSEPEENHCKILFNVRCLSEGVDVPSLDAVLFLSPRKSQVEVVQTVGRVMRTSRSTNKKRGYVIIPIVTPLNIPADAVIDNNKSFEVVWQILRALKSIDDDFGAVVDGQLGTINKDKMEVICLTDDLGRKRTRGSKVKTPGSGKKRKQGTAKKGRNAKSEGQLDFEFGHDEILEEKIRARIVKKVGNRKEWSDWAKDVGIICTKQVEHIETILEKPENGQIRDQFDKFTDDLKKTLNGDLTKKEILEMLGQHIVTKPVLDALFSEFPFTEKNPIARAMTETLKTLDEGGMRSATKLLDSFYKSVQARAKTIQTAEDRQTVVIELFDKFFKVAFSKMRDKLGIVYTPIPVVDFINHSVADVLKKEFNTTIDEKNVHILDPFTGTGTFLTRLMQSGLIPKDRLEDKFNHDMHAYEIVPLAYYIASINLEATLHDLLPEEKYRPNPIMVWTDTFANHNSEGLFSNSLEENNSRLAESNRLDIRVIVGNPPYSAGQSEMDEGNQNQSYPDLEKRIRETYTNKSEKKGGKRSTFDPYILAYRWASDRIKEKGVIGFVTNAGWIESNSADGMRKCIAEEFNSIYILHLKGNQRTSGERSRREGGKIFGEGSRSPVAIVILVKNPDDKEKGKIYFHAVEDYLTREEKLQQLVTFKSATNIKWQRIYPDRHGDWLDLRDESAGNFISLDPKEGKVFKLRSGGVVTSKDDFLYNSSKVNLLEVVKGMNTFFNQEAERFKRERPPFMDNPKIEPKEKLKLLIDWVKKSPKEFSWGGNGWHTYLKNNIKQTLDNDLFYISCYRPFIKQMLYASKCYAHSFYSLGQLFPKPTFENLAICVTGAGAKQFSCLMVDKIPCFDMVEKSQCFPRYIYKPISPEENGEKELFEFETSCSETQTYDGFTREDGISTIGLSHFQEAYPNEVIDPDDLFYYIYGILYSSDYRTKYANNLSKELPRIPRVATYDQFKAFAGAGRKLADLHVNYEMQPRYSGVNIKMKPGASFKVTQMRWGKISGKKGEAAKDKSRLIYNEDIIIENVPLKAQEFVINKKSALDWLVEKCNINVDSKSGIVNDFNKYGEELGNVSYLYQGLRMNLFVN